MKFRLSRRAVLRGAFGAALALPRLEAMGQSAPVKRLVLFFSPNGTLYPQWQCSQGASGLVLSPILSPLEPWKQQLLVLGNVDMNSALHGVGDDHVKGMAQLWTATELDGTPTGAQWAGGASIDQAVAGLIGGTTALRSLELGVQVRGSNVHHRMSYRGPSQPLPPEEDPQVAFERLFAGFSGDPAAVARRKARRLSLIDAVKGEFDAVSAKAGVEDRRRLDAHATAVRELERKLEAVPQPLAACKVPETPPGVDLSDSSTFEQVGQLQMDLLAMALTCDLTRVASLQYSFSGSQRVFKELGATKDHHELSHQYDDDLEAAAQLLKINQWYSKQFGYLLGKLSDANALSDSLILWGNELGKGNLHSHAQVPFVLAGGLVTGNRWLDTNHAPHGNLLTSVARTFGADVNSFGNPAYCTGTLSL